MSEIKMLPLPEPNYKWVGYTAREAEAIARAVAEHNVAERDAQIAQLEKANEQLHAHGERMHEQLQKMRAAQQPPAEAVGTVLGGEFHYLRVNHGLPDGTKLYTPPPSAPVGVAADILRIVDTAIDVCNDRDRPAMAEDLEAVRLYVEQASAALAHQPAACTHSWHDYGTVNRARCSRCNAVAVIGHEDCPYGTLSVTDDGEYRTNPIQPPAAAGELAELAGLLDEVRSHFTRDDDLPDDLLPRIDAALAAQQGDES